MKILLYYLIEYKEQHFGPVKKRAYGAEEDALRAAKDRILAKAEVYKYEDGKRTLVWARVKG